MPVWSRTSDLAGQICCVLAVLAAAILLWWQEVVLAVVRTLEISMNKVGFWSYVLVSGHDADGLLRAAIAGLPWWKRMAVVLAAGSFTNKRSWLRGKLLGGVLPSLLQSSR